jgi:hypothetical protein
LSGSILFANLAQVRAEGSALVADLVTIAAAHAFGLEEDFAAGFNIAAQRENLDRIDHGAEPPGALLFGQKPLENVADFRTGAVRRFGDDLVADRFEVTISRRSTVPFTAALVGL